MSLSPTQLDAVTRTVLGEAEGEGAAGETAVASVIRNRATSGQFGSSDPAAIVMQPNQFSTWNSIKNGGNTIARDADPNSPQYQHAAQIVASVFDGETDDPTNGATYYHTTSVDPGWNMYKTASIGNHVFFSPSPVPPMNIPSVKSELDVTKPTNSSGSPDDRSLFAASGAQMPFPPSADVRTLPPISSDNPLPAPAPLTVPKNVSGSPDDRSPAPVVAATPVGAAFASLGPAAMNGVSRLNPGKPTPISGPIDKNVLGNAVDAAFDTGFGSVSDPRQAALIAPQAPATPLPTGQVPATGISETQAENRASRTLFPSTTPAQTAPKNSSGSPDDRSSTPIVLPTPSTGSTAPKNTSGSPDERGSVSLGNVMASAAPPAPVAAAPKKSKNSSGSPDDRDSSSLFPSSQPVSTVYVAPSGEESAPAQAATVSMPSGARPASVPAYVAPNSSGSPDDRDTPAPNSSGSPDDRDSGAYSAAPVAPVPVSTPNSHPVVASSSPSGKSNSKSASPTPVGGGQQTITGSASGRTYVVGQVYSNNNGNYVAQANGTFAKVA